MQRSCAKHGIAFQDAHANEVYTRVPKWGPHPDVTTGLTEVSKHIPLVILSNAMEAQIPQNVASIPAPFAHVLTAEGAGAYKPQLRAFEYMFDCLGCGPQDVAHVSSSFRYDLMCATDLHIPHRIWVNRGHEPRAEGYAAAEITDIGGLAGSLGL